MRQTGALHFSFQENCKGLAFGSVPPYGDGLTHGTVGVPVKGGAKRPTCAAVLIAASVKHL
jgi:hypothetical protein